MIAGLARTGRADILRAAEAVRGAERSRIHIFLSTSPLHMKYKLRMEPEAVLQLTIDSVLLARQYAEDVEWSAEDGSRTEPDFLCRCVEAAIKAGATTINIPDTVGYALPEDMHRIFTMLRERVPGADEVILSTHNHNDLGFGGGQHHRRPARRRAPGGVHGERHRRAGRQRGARGSGDGHPHPAGRGALQHRHRHAAYPAG